MMKKILLFFTLWKLFDIFVALVAQRYLPLQHQAWIGYLFSKDPNPLLWMWANFDGVNYLYIAREGYGYPNFAFFPLLPLIIFLVNKLFALPYLYVGIAVTNIAFLLGAFVLYKLIANDFSKQIAINAVLILLLFPFSYYYGAVYTDALFFFLATLSFYFARKSQWLNAGVAGYFAGLSRLVGIVLFFALFIEWYQQQKSRKNFKKVMYIFIKEKAYFLFLIPFGLVSYSLYLQLFHHDFLLFQKAMENWHQESFVFPLQVLYRYGKILFTADKNFIYLVAVVELLTFLSYTLIAGYVLKYVRLSYGIFMLSVLLLPTFTGTFQSMPRYGLHTFPLFLALALLLKNKKILFYGICLLFLLLHGFFAALYFQGFFIA